MKKCKRCLEEKQSSNYRTFTHKNGHKWQRGICKSCEPVVLKEQRHRCRPEMKFNNKRTEHTICEYQKNWVKNNREKNNTKAKKHYLKINSEISDSYCRGVLFQNFKITSDMITPELIKLKRKQIQSWRKLQALKNSSPVHQK